jgi:hypothetical protein
MIQYKIQNNIVTGEQNGITIVGRQISIPLDPNNTDYQKYLEWVEAGNTPEPADE